MLDSLNNVGLGIGADKDAGSEPTSQTLESTTPSDCHQIVRQHLFLPQSVVRSLD